MLDIYRGAPAIYTTYYGYDDLAHHYGPNSGQARRSLRGIDKRVRQIDRLRRACLVRDYDLYVLSDHGMTTATPFSIAFGETLAQFVSRLPAEGVQVTEEGGDEQHSAHEAQFLLEELKAIEKNLAGPLAKVAGKVRRLVTKRVPSPWLFPANSSLSWISLLRRSPAAQPRPP